MKTRRVAEATVVLRRSGVWSAYLGPAGMWQRWYLPYGGIQPLDRRLGMLATCIGTLFTAALEDAGTACQSMRVNLRSPIQAESVPTVTVIGHISMECEANTQTARDCFERCVRQDPLLVLITREFEAVNIAVESHSGTAIIVS